MVWRSLHHKEILLSEPRRNKRECIYSRTSPKFVITNDLLHTNKQVNVRKKGRELTQSYDKSPYTHRKIQNAVVRQKSRSVKESNTQPSQNSNEVNNDTRNTQTRGTLLQLHTAAGNKCW